MTITLEDVKHDCDFMLDDGGPCDQPIAEREGDRWLCREHRSRPEE